MSPEDDTRQASIQRRCVDTHNRVRRNLTNPRPAKPLAPMTWLDEAGETARRYAADLAATNCLKLKHSHPVSKWRTLRSGVACGENLALFSWTGKTRSGSWQLAMRGWANEKKDYAFGCQEHRGVVGHYTQMIWADSLQLGCGAAKCARGQWQSVVYVCHYCPA